MKITEVRIKLMDDPGDRLRAFCSITFDDCFVIRDLKIIEGGSGPFVAMPSRKLMSHCPQCGCKNHLRSSYCNQCGLRLKEELAIKDQEGRAKLYADIAHPINSKCREMIQDRVIDEFHAELERAQQSDYVPRYDDYFTDAEMPATDEGPPPAASSIDDSTQIQPAELEPRPPHSMPSQRPTTRSGHHEKGDEFGAGVF